ncbi:uncharacterized protein LOC128211455 [Mya arenaria]|uniref:uncharacterized protein LOC128211455 n=1 Tax=Mya arenaria TaxID=6604 RepID=UPI0022E70CED|nr:uncharacterized protein LOC128211455 [Mya arenaria]
MSSFSYGYKTVAEGGTESASKQNPGCDLQWEGLNIFYRCKESRTPRQWFHKMNTSILQYIFTQKGKRVTTALGNKGMEFKLDQTCNICRIEIVYSQELSPDTLKELFENHILRGEVTYRIDLRKKSTEEVKRKAEHLNLTSDSHGAVYFDKSGRQLNCVAENNDVLDALLIEIGYEEVDRVRLNDISGPVLHDLQFTKEIQLYHSNITDIIFEDKDVVFMWNGRKQQSGCELLTQFENKVKRCSVLEGCRNARHIVFDSQGDGHVNNAYIQYIRNRTEHSKGLVCPLFTFGSDGKTITLLTLGELEPILDVVDQSITERQLDKETAYHFFKGDYSQGFLVNGTRSRKLKYSTKTNKIVCTSDLEIELEDLINQATPYRKELLHLSDFHVSFLNRFAMPLKEQVQREYHIELILEHNRCFLQGKDPQLLKEGREFFIGSLNKRFTRFSTNINEVAVLKLKAKIENVTSENNCSWKLNFTNECCNIDLSKYLGAWHDPLANIIICVQNVDNGDLVAADLVIEMTTSNLFPLSKLFIKESTSLKQLQSGKRVLVGHEETLDGPFQSDTLCCKSMYVVVIYSSQGNEESITFSKLKECFSRALQYADNNGMESLALSTKLLQDFPIEKHITPSIFASLKEYVDLHHQHRFKKIILCCENENSQDICNVVENMHETRKGYRRILSLPLNPSRENTPIQSNVKVGSITESMRDVIVTTVNANLNFARGQVSKMILEKAGPKMQAECKKKYPYGIAHDQIAYTKSHRMGDSGYVKYLFHGALPNYSFHDYEKTVKNFVKRCLYLADRLDCRSLVFPAIGVGNLGYPRRETAAAMFEAIEEYPKEAANCGIQEVDIMVFEGDRKSCMNFRAEEWRKSTNAAKLRHKLAGTTEVKPVPCQVLVKNIGEDTKVKIARVGACRQPTFAVEIVMRVGSIGIKPASTHPQSWNDQIDVCFECAGIANIDIEKLGSILLDERITEVFFFADKKDKLPFSKQVILLANLVQQLAENTKKPTYLKTCTIFVDDQVEDVVLASDEGWKWTECAEESNIAIELLGQTEECVERARISIESLLNKTKKEEFSRQEERMMGDVDNENRHLGSERVLDDQDSEGSESENETEEIEISAVINKGIIAQHEPELKEWLLSMKQKFNLNVNQKRKDVSVSGTIASVLQFESHLKTCVRDYAKSDRNVYPQTVVYMDEKSFSLLSGIGALSRYAVLPSVKGWTFDVAKGLVITCKKEHMEYVRTQVTEDLNKMKRECIVFENDEKAKEARANLENTNLTEDSAIVCRNSEITIGSFDYGILRECFDGMLPMMPNTRRIRTSDVELKFTVNDIRNESVEFIAISSSAKMTGRKGAGKLLADMLGKDFLESCEKSLKEKGDIQEYECRVIPSGLAYRRFIGHLRLPVNEKKQSSQRIQFIRLEDSILNCFKRADEMGCKSIALPCLGSEENKGGFDLHNCANAYVQAFFKLRSSNLKEICFVDLNADKINTVFETFFGTLGRQHQLQKESTV